MELHGHYHRKSLRIPLDIHDFSWSIPWNIYGFFEYGHGKPMHVFPMDSQYIGFPLGLLSMAIQKTWVLHEKSMITLASIMPLRSWAMGIEDSWENHGKSIEQ